jgi:tRNA-specific 2-thiouridylase
VGDVEDARRVAQQIGVDHYVFNFSDDFERHVVDPYVESHATGSTPNPCIECNRHLKFDRLIDRADQLGFDAVATGHHARIVQGPDAQLWLARGADSAKDQSYVVHMLGAETLPKVMFPVGGMTKQQVRAKAVALGLQTAAKPDSQDVCFISGSGGRSAFLSERIRLRPAKVLDEAGSFLGEVPAVEMVTVGQRRGLGPAVGARYALSVDVQAATVTVAPADRLLVSEVRLDPVFWVREPPGGDESLLAQVSAHGEPVPARWEAAGRVCFERPVRKVAPGQSVVVYRGDLVVGGGTAAY